MTTIRANPHVSNAVLKGLANGNKPNVISSTEWTNIKKTALQQIKTSDNPKATLGTIRESLRMANRTSGGKLRESISKFIKTELAEAVSNRQAALKRGPTVRTWGGYGGGGGSYGGRT